MNNNLHEPIYGPSNYAVNFDVSPKLRDYVDATIHLLFFIPAKFILTCLSKALYFAENLEMKIVQHRSANLLAPHS